MLRKLRGIVTKHKYVFVAVILVSLLFCARYLSEEAKSRYTLLLSEIVYDRNGVPIHVATNTKGHYVLSLTYVPENFKELLITKEDRFFYSHPGINPVSMLRACLTYVFEGKTGGSSTITQQLVKNILETENDRTIKNKIRESLYAVSLELFVSKEDILLMYANSAYLGNQIQGFNTASLAYFDKPLSEASYSEQIALLATLSYPSARNPWESDNTSYAEALSKRIAPSKEFVAPQATKTYSLQHDSYFELDTAGITCEHTCISTIDDSLTSAIREVLKEHIVAGEARNIRNGAVVVLDPKHQELLALVGSKDPDSTTGGDQINMAIESRPIGSTIKPFIYGKGFEMGLRPYTIVEDREYKYPIATGFSLYPKNYDGQYRGTVTLHEALSNSLNVPSVKVLEYVGLENFYGFLSDKLLFEPTQDYDSYQYGIALGGLEMDLMTLTYYFSIFPNEGTLKPLRAIQEPGVTYTKTPQSHVEEETEVLEPEYVELINIILRDRLRGVNQFGLVSNLNVPDLDYGVKTGTSRDYHDSWVVGYTPDFVVGVWIGNVENEALTQVSGQAGAGSVWHDVMQLLSDSSYNSNGTFSFHHVVNQQIDDSDEWGLPEDTVSYHRELLRDDQLIRSIHPDDVFVYTENTTIPLQAKKNVNWSINGVFFAEGSDVTFRPPRAGSYEVTASDPDSEDREIVSIDIILPQ